MVALGFGQRLGTVEPLVEVRIQVMDLMCEHRAERTAVGRESPVPLVHVLAVGDGGGDGMIRVGWDACLDSGSILPARGCATVAKRARSLGVLVIHESQHSFFHAPVVRRTEGLD